MLGEGPFLERYRSGPASGVFTDGSSGHGLTPPFAVYGLLAGEGPSGAGGASARGGVADESGEDLCGAIIPSAPSVT